MKIPLVTMSSNVSYGVVNSLSSTHLNMSGRLSDMIISLPIRNFAFFVCIQ